MASSDLFTTTGAIFSPCRTWRYLWWVRWAEGPMLYGLCLNPSYADEQRRDNTVTQMMRRAKALGFAGFAMLNAFAYVSTNPKGLLTCADPVGPENDATILEHAQRAGMVICGWGNSSPLIAARAAHIRKMLAGVPLHYLILTKDGQPHHPLRIGYEVQPKEWKI